MDFSKGYIDPENDLETKQNLLRSAASAWNIACADEAYRTKSIKNYLKTYKKMNPSASKTDIKDLEKDLKLLIKQKIELYPHEQIQIMDVKAEMKDGKLHVTVLSAKQK